jgi:hypothetical protein
VSDKCDGKSPIENTPEMVFQLHGIRDDFMKGFVAASSVDDELALAGGGRKLGGLTALTTPSFLRGK